MQDRPKQCKPLLRSVKQCSFLKILEFNAVNNWCIWKYKISRRLFGATCKAWYARVQRADIGLRWFLQNCSTIFLQHRCRVCAETVLGLPFWQQNGIVHYGCLHKKEAYERLAPSQEEVYLSLQWGFPNIHWKNEVVKLLLYIFLILCRSIGRWVVGVTVGELAAGGNDENGFFLCWSLSSQQFPANC